LQVLQEFRTIRGEKQTVMDLIELFHDVDVNGDKHVEWSEFFSYCIESGIVATRKAMPPIQHKYAPVERFIGTFADN
jgi:hypothetical protein